MTSEIQALLNELYSLQRLGIKTGLEHTFQLLEACDNPHKNLKLIHIAGTNGKGSTAAFVFNILRTAGYKVGLYTSPHLVKFNERIRIDGHPISDEYILKFMANYLDKIKRIESTFFETTSAMAFWYFERQKVDIAVIETGLGGRLDSTNVIKPIISIITPISMDHQEVLGHDIRTIAKEKAGIIKQNTPVVSSEQEEDVMVVLNNAAEKMNAKIKFVPSPSVYSMNIDGVIFKNDKHEIKISLLGAHQLVNASLAVEGLNTCFNHIPPIDISMGLQNTQWPGRLQVLSKNPPVFYDVAHNEQGIEKMLHTVSNLFDQKPMGLLALKEDKELASICRTIKKKFDSLFVIDDNDQLLMNKHNLSKKLNDYGIESFPIENLDDFRSKIKTHTPVVIFGTHYIADAVYKEFQFSFDSGVI